MTKHYVDGELMDLSVEEQAEYDTESRVAHANRLPLWRADATLSRSQFCVGLHAIGVLPAVQAIQAARGEWPATFSKVLASVDDPTVQEITWAGTLSVERNSALLDTLRVAAGLTHADLDRLFGWDPTS